MNRWRTRWASVLSGSAFIAVVAAGCGSADSRAGLSRTDVSTATVASTTVAATYEPDGTPHWEGATQGKPAIVPSNPDATTGSTFSERDVREYFDANPPILADPSAPQPEIVSVEFLPVEDIEKIINHPVAIPQGQLLCLVTIAGTWLVPAEYDVITTPETDIVRFEIFDARTGNLIARTAGTR